MNLEHGKGKIGVIALTLLIAGAIDSIRNLPATALFGSTLIFFFIFSALVFLIPAALVSAELTSTNTEEGGIFVWVRSALGNHVGFLAIWLQWINTMIWYPTILSFIAGTLTYFVDPALAQDKMYLISVILIVFWIMTVINLKGLSLSSHVASFCAIVGMIVPMGLIITLAAIWIFSGNPIHVSFTAANMLPSLSHTDNWISLTAIMTAFLGMELATVHVKEVRNAQKNFPKALIFAVILILITMIAGALSIAIVLPQNKIDLVDGVMQAFSAFLNAYHLHWMTPVLVVMILLGSLGSMINWIISPAKGLFQAAEQGYLPAGLAKKNSKNVPANILILQAILVSVLCLVFLLMPSVNGSYWLLTDLSTQLYMFMYVLMFIAALVLKHRPHHVSRATFLIPGKKLGGWITCLLGLLGCTLTIIVGFFPPASLNVGGAAHYEIVFTTGLIVMSLPALLGLLYKTLKTITPGKTQLD